MRKIPYTIALATLVVCQAQAGQTVTALPLSPRYIYVELANPPGSTASEALSINAAGDVTGNSSYQVTSRATLWRKGGAGIDLGTGLGSAFGQSIGRKILDDGTIWGNSDFLSTQPGSAASYRDGKWFSIGTGFTDPTSFAGAFGANNKGLVVGQRAPFVPPPSMFETFSPQAFVWQSGVFTPSRSAARTARPWA